MATTMPSTLRLPTLLLGHVDDLLAALSEHNPQIWPEEKTFLEAPQPEAIGKVLVDSIHQHLHAAEIGYLFREKMTDRDRTRLAQASRVTGKLAHYSNLDLLIEVNWEQWRILPDARRIALIDHELCHFAKDADNKGNTVYKVVAHDLEEFNAIARRWGAWKRDLHRFGQALHAGEQQDLFAND